MTSTDQPHGAATLLDQARTTSEPRSPLRWVNLSNAMTELTAAPRFVVTDYLPRRVVTLLGGHGGAGKTTLALTIAAHVAAGQSFADLSTVQGRVLFVSLEDEAAVMKWRLRQVIGDCGLDANKVLSNFALLDGSGEYAALIREAESSRASTKLTAAFHALESHATGHELVIVDNASDGFDADENSRRAVRAFIRQLGQVAKANDAALILLAHIDKAAARSGSFGNSYSGSTAWHNSARSRLALVESRENGLELLHEKANFGRLRDPLPMQRSRHGIPIPKAPGPEPGDSMIEERLRRGILAAFRAAAEEGTDISSRLTRGNGCAMKTLALFDEYPEALQGSAAAEKRAGKLLMQMKRERLIVREHYKDEYRHDKKRLVLADCADTTADQCGAASGAA